MKKVCMFFHVSLPLCLKLCSHITFIDMNIHTTVMPDKRRILKGDKYPIKLRVTCNRQRRYYSISHERREGINFLVTDDEWDKIKSDSPKGRYKIIANLISQLVNEADGIAAKVVPFSFESFKAAYEKKEAGNNVFAQFEDYIDRLKNEGRVGTYRSYRDALNSLRKYGLPENFENVTANDLKKYEKYMLDNGKSITTVGIYLRNLRAIFNIARKEKLTDNYPFSEYVIPSSVNIKKALDLEVIEKIISYNAVEFSSLDKARDMWLFSYFSNGLNIADICNIKCGSVDLNTMEISFEREKSKRQRTKTKIIVDIMPETLSIMKKWGDLDGDKTDFVFPYFRNDMTPEQKKNATHGVVKSTNKYMNKIFSELRIPINVTTYYARHSFANVLKQTGAPYEFISESLGHSDLKTTLNYLKSFSSENRKKWNKNLNPNNIDLNK